MGMESWSAPDNPEGGVYWGNMGMSRGDNWFACLLYVKAMGNDALGVSRYW
jgi:hypothetical protein